MNNLPIPPCNVQAQGGPINPALPGSSMDTLAQASPEELPFAKLLAQQLAENGYSVSDAAVIIDAIGMDVEEISIDVSESLGVADIANNPAATLAALLVQLPGHKTGSGATSPESGYTSAQGSIQVSGTGHISASESIQVSGTGHISAPGSIQVSGTGHISAPGSIQVSETGHTSAPGSIQVSGTGHTSAPESIQVSGTGHTSASESIQVSGTGLTSAPESTQASDGRVMQSLTGLETAPPKPDPVEEFSLPQSGNVTSEKNSARTTSALVDAPSLNVAQSDTAKLLDRFALANQPSSSNSNSSQQPASSMPIAAMTPGDRLGNNAASGIQRAIATPLGSNAWADDFSQSINWLVTQNNQIAELRLNPPDLGPLNVVLKISDNHATLLFTSPHGSVRDAVESALPKLREILADNGIMLGNATVSDQSLSDRGAQNFAAQNHSSTALHSAQDENLLPAAPATPMRRHNGMVDTFA